MRLYGDIQKVDVEQRMVWGYASTEALDAHGETVTKAAIEEALAAYLEYANVREMHQLSAVGLTKEASVDDKGLYVGVHVVDDTAWGKVTSGLYKGFSIGGKTLERDSKNRKIITKILLNEISLVDRPSNPEARFDVWKAAGSTNEDADMAAKTDKTIELKVDTIADTARIDALAKTAGQTVIDAQAAADLLAKNVAAGNTDAAIDPAAAGAVVAVVDAPAVVADAAVADITKAAVAEVVAADAPIGTVTVVVDPITKAIAALDLFDAATAADLNKGLYAVGRFAEMLESLSYLASSAQYESESEADGSPVPAKLRDWLKTGAGIFKDMAKEEIDELIASTAVKKAAASEALHKAAGTADPAFLTAHAAALLAERDDLAKALAEKDDVLTKLADRVVSTIDSLVTSNADLKKRLDAYDDAPALAKTAGSHAVAALSKEDDAAGAALAKVAAPTSDELGAALAAMPEDERAMLLTKAALKMPRAVTYGRLA